MSEQNPAEGSRGRGQNRRRRNGRPLPKPEGQERAESPDRNDRSRRGRGRNRHDHSPPLFKIDPQACALCGEMILEMTTAIAYGADKAPCHMECVTKDLAPRHGLEEGERLVYWGAGQFAVVKGEGKEAYQVRRKIEVEGKDALPDWRRDIRNQLPRG